MTACRSQYYLFDFYRTDSFDLSKDKAYAVIGEYDYFVPSRLNDDSIHSPLPDLREIVLPLECEGAIVDHECLTSFNLACGLLMRFDLHDNISPMIPAPRQGQLKVARHLANELGREYLFFCSLSLCSIYLACNLYPEGLDKTLKRIFEACQHPNVQPAILRSTSIPFGREPLYGQDTFSVNAIVRIDTPLHSQGKIQQELLLEQPSMQVLAMTGDDDLLIRTGTFDFGRLIGWLDSLQKKHLHTHTCLEISYEFPAYPEFAESKRDLTVDFEHFGENRGKVERVVRQLTDARAYLPADFVHQIARILRTIGADVSPTKRLDPHRRKQIPEILDIIHEALLQRRVKRTDVSFDTDLQRSGLSLGAYFSLRALDYIARVYYEGIRDALPITLREEFSPWSGLILASDRHGFAALPYGIILVPYRALLDPISPQGYWNTLSHEIAHLFSAVIMELPGIQLAIHNITKLFADFLDIPTHEISRNLQHDANEITAHWIDFIYPYGGKFEHFANSIWSTWAPLLEADPLDYRNDRCLNFHLRTFCIFICSRTTEYLSLPQNLPNFDTQEFEELKSKIGRAYSDYAEQVKSINLVSNEYMQLIFDRIIERKLVTATLRLVPVLFWLQHNLANNAKSISDHFRIHTFIRTQFVEAPTRIQKIDALLAIIDAIEQETYQ